MWIVTLVVFKQNRFHGTVCNLLMNIMELQLWLKWLRQGCCRVMAFGPLSFTKHVCHGNVLYRHESQLWITFCTYIDANTLRSMPLKTSNFAWNLPRHICTHCETGWNRGLNHHIARKPLIYSYYTTTPTEHFSMGHLKSEWDIVAMAPFITTIGFTV